MGKEFLEAKKKRYKRKMDEERQKQLGTPDLLTALAERIEMLLRFECFEHADPPVGASVYFALVPSARLAQVYQGNSKVRIGEVDEAGTTELRALTERFPQSAGVYNAIVREGKDWTGYAKAQLDTL